MNLKSLIEQLQVLEENLETKGDTPVFITEQGMIMGAMQLYLRDLEYTDIKFEQDLSAKPLVIESPSNEGVIIGYIPIYEQKEI